MQKREVLLPSTSFSSLKKKYSQSLWSMTCSVNYLSLHVQPVGQQVGPTPAASLRPQRTIQGGVRVSSGSPCFLSLAAREPCWRTAPGTGGRCRQKEGAVCAGISRCKGLGGHFKGTRGLWVTGPATPGGSGQGALVTRAVLPMGRAPQDWETRAFQDITEPSPMARPTSL